MNEDMMVPKEEALTIPDLDGVVEYFQNYQELTEKLLTKEDYQSTGNKRFKKKSAWRKYQTAFNISDEIIKEELITDDRNRIVTARYTVRATAPNGRSAVGVGVCSLYDKIHKNDKEEPTDFTLRKRFSNAEHDIPATAHTRAKSRAISDLIGSGEVSAEEMELVENEEGKTFKKRKKRVKKEEDEKTIEAEVVKEKKPTLEELTKKYTCIKHAVQDIRDENIPVTKANIISILLAYIEIGKINNKQYNMVKPLVEELEE